MIMGNVDLGTGRGVERLTSAASHRHAAAADGDIHEDAGLQHPGHLFALEALLIQPSPLDRLHNKED